LAIEEAGKSPVLRSIARASDEEAIKDGWKAFRNHQVKNVFWPFPMYVLSGVRTVAGFGSLSCTQFSGISYAETKSEGRSLPLI
jgi:AbiV family abortive infection protein